jgi:hypothetical protein
MYKIRYYLFLLLLGSCGTKIEFEPISTFQEKYPFNYIGLVGDSSDSAYIEVYYSEANQNKSNVTTHKWIKLPAIIGGQETVVTFDSIIKRVTGTGKTRIEPVGREAKINYSDSRSHYMKIINHGIKPVEFFIVGNHPIKTYDLNRIYAGPFIEKGDNHIAPPTTITSDLLPEVFYKGAPIKYLLFPEMKPKTNLFKINKDGVYSKDGKEYYGYSGIDTLFFENNRIGDLIVNNAWSVSQVVDLYRAEYKGSNDTILTIAYCDTKEDIQKYRIYIGAEKYYSEIKTNPLKPFYYGIIPAGGTIQSSEQIPFITHVNYEYYQDKSSY